MQNQNIPWRQLCQEKIISVLFARSALSALMALAGCSATLWNSRKGGKDTGDLIAWRDLLFFSQQKIWSDAVNSLSLCHGHGWLILCSCDNRSLAVTSAQYQGSLTDPKLSCLKLAFYKPGIFFWWHGNVLDKKVLLRILTKVLFKIPLPTHMPKSYA